MKGIHPDGTAWKGQVTRFRFVARRFGRRVCQDRKRRSAFRRRRTEQIDYSAATIWKLASFFFTTVRDAVAPPLPLIVAPQEALLFPTIVAE